MMKQLNKVNRLLLVEVPKHPKLMDEQFLKAYENGLTVIDTGIKRSLQKGLFEIVSTYRAIIPFLLGQAGC